MKTHSSVIALIIAGVTAASAAHAQTETTSGNIKKCTVAYTAGFLDDHVFEGYCIGKWQFARESNDDGELLKIARSQLGAYAEMEFSKYGNDVGCSPILFAKKPGACLKRSVYSVKSLKVNGAILFEGKAD